jgi:hypothetical protein
MFLFVFKLSSSFVKNFVYFLALCIYDELQLDQAYMSLDFSGFVGFTYEKYSTLDFPLKVSIYDYVIL